ncbi:hypothetical protein [Ruania halotolerans]|uniref:hypothetical protein n=1 Tax=Ruania halotolerans TaxID=2897773 RepID=UPI001E53FAA7|nr:hypothetical protein [Ruania halotolerans]UFU06455.1 hypothetical protein LQF10_18860 [Ruania halotolerans]
MAELLPQGRTLSGSGPGGSDDDVTVMVEFTPEGADASLDNGTEVAWGFILTEESGRWLVRGAGQG